MLFPPAVLILSAVLGSIIGTRFKVLALLPGTFVVAVVTAGTGVLCGMNFSSIALASFLGVSGLQIGYIAGATICALMLSTRLPSRPRSIHSTAPYPGSHS